MQPNGAPLEILGELVLFLAVRLGLDTTLHEVYQERQSTLSEYQQRIAVYLGLKRFNNESGGRSRPSCSRWPRVWSGLSLFERIDRLREVKQSVRWTALACFLWQSYVNSVD